MPPSIFVALEARCLGVGTAVRPDTGTALSRRKPHG
jgi:hypothetical protein